MIRLRTIKDILKFYGENNNSKINFIVDPLESNYKKDYNVVAHSKVNKKIIEGNLQKSQTIIVIVKNKTTHKILALTVSKNSSFKNIFFYQIGVRGMSINNFEVINKKDFGRFIKERVLEKIE